MNKRIHLLTFAIALLFAGLLPAQHVQVAIGSGTLEEPTLPFCNYYRYGTAQMLYRHQEFGGQKGYIDTLWFYSATANTLTADTLWSSPVTLDLTGLPTGAYFVRLSGDSYNAVRKLIVK